MAGMCWHVGYLWSARATLEVVFCYLSRQINRRITLPYLTIAHAASMAHYTSKLLNWFDYLLQSYGRLQSCFHTRGSPCLPNRAHDLPDTHLLFLTVNKAKNSSFSYFPSVSVFSACQNFYKVVNNRYHLSVYVCHKTNVHGKRIVVKKN
jgi:hypothetical protein